MNHFRTIKKITKPLNGLVITLFNGRGGEDRTPVDGVGVLFNTFKLFSRIPY